MEQVTEVTIAPSHVVDSAGPARVGFTNIGTLTSMLPLREFALARAVNHADTPDEPPQVEMSRGWSSSWFPAGCGTER